ncbi:MAG: hypothetical protein V7L08_12270 [Nostoc sp.]
MSAFVTLVTYNDSCLMRMLAKTAGVCDRTAFRRKAYRTPPRKQATRSVWQRRYRSL